MEALLVDFTKSLKWCYFIFDAPTNTSDVRKDSTLKENITIIILILYHCLGVVTGYYSAGDVVEVSGICKNICLPTARSGSLKFYRFPI